MARVFAGTNVLFPFSTMDLLLALTEDMVHEVIWTERLLAEWQRVIVREQRRSPASAEAIASAIREYFPEGCVPEEYYAHLSPTMPGDDPDDRHHMAAALAGRAQSILTWNLADFPSAPLAELGLRVIDPDTYLCELFEELPDEITKSVVRMAAEKRRPPRTPEDLAGALDKAGVPDFAERLRLRGAPSP
ncbi:PIN domain-containing protein [Nocardiopsis nanhaiensis]